MYITLFLSKPRITFLELSWIRAPLKYLSIHKVLFYLENHLLRFMLRWFQRLKTVTELAILVTWTHCYLLVYAVLVVPLYKKEREGNLEMWEAQKAGPSLPVTWVWMESYLSSSLEREGWFSKRHCNFSFSVWNGSRNLLYPLGDWT